MDIDFHMNPFELPVFTEGKTLKKYYIEVIKYFLSFIDSFPTNDSQNRCFYAKKMYDYLIEKDVLEEFKKHKKLLRVIKNKLKEFERTDVPGPYNPRVWSPVARNQLFPRKPVNGPHNMDF